MYCFGISSFAGNWNKSLDLIKYSIYETILSVLVDILWPNKFAGSPPEITIQKQFISN